MPSTQQPALPRFIPPSSYSLSLFFCHLDTRSSSHRPSLIPPFPFFLPSGLGASGHDALTTHTQRLIHTLSLLPSRPLVSLSSFALQHASLFHLTLILCWSLLQSVSGNVEASHTRQQTPTATTLSQRTHRQHDEFHILNASVVRRTLHRGAHYPSELFFGKPRRLRAVLLDNGYRVLEPAVCL
ncbi:hypothetical protein BC939DRAFT_106040 [Gamsiella multidivaricata]|uniref:uncharacterized protein n=1 Tax=Gamsiella multidivaricata TaxID=101098 RepID=UPI0022209DC5|nr:uncharacterized protein BC939DRAFT_106040 [Gamsiella multidivaricata]KAI7826870.1 hypothetical protein BC939DRAFT_106040 [Gamsiella multidivaricata]